MGSQPVLSGGPLARRRRREATHGRLEERLTSGSVVLSLVGHVLVGLAVIVLSVVASSRADDSSRYVVTLLPASPHGAPAQALRAPTAAPRRPSPAPSEPHPSQAAPPHLERTPVPPAPTQIAAAPEASGLVAPRAAVSGPLSSTEAPPPRPPEPLRPPVRPSAEQTPGPPAAPSAPPSAGDPLSAAAESAGRTNLDVSDFPFTYYLRQIQTKISERWTPPQTVTAGGARAVIRFEIGRDGHVSGQVLERSSGDAGYDQSALRAVAEASPLPPLPAEFKAASLRVHFGFGSPPERG